VVLVARLCRLSQRTIGHFDHGRKDFDHQVFKVVINFSEVGPLRALSPPPTREAADRFRTWRSIAPFSRSQRRTARKKGVRARGWKLVRGVV
jgi:hypothetical protein